jgi:TonB family protein
VVNRASAALTQRPGDSSEAFAPQEPTYAAVQVDVPARLIESAPLRYPPDARAAEIEASVPLEIIVDGQGRVISQRVLARAGHGLDEAALAAVRAYRFSPARRQGLPVRVRMRWQVQFRLL